MFGSPIFGNSHLGALWAYLPVGLRWTDCNPLQAANYDYNRHPNVRPLEARGLATYPKPFRRIPKLKSRSFEGGSCQAPFRRTGSQIRGSTFQLLDKVWVEVYITIHGARPLGLGIHGFKLSGLGNLGFLFGVSRFC